MFVVLANRYEKRVCEFNPPSFSQICRSLYPTDVSSKARLRLIQSSDWDRPSLESTMYRFFKLVIHHYCW
jgi:hypothetical protein